MKMLSGITIVGRKWQLLPRKLELRRPVTTRRQVSEQGHLKLVRAVAVLLTTVFDLQQRQVNCHRQRWKWDQRDFNAFIGLDQILQRIEDQNHLSIKPNLKQGISLFQAGWMSYRFLIFSVGAKNWLLPYIYLIPTKKPNGYIAWHKRCQILYSYVNFTKKAIEE